MPISHLPPGAHGKGQVEHERKCNVCGERPGTGVGITSHLEDRFPEVF
jgi:hypothetical protein